HPAAPARQDSGWGSYAHLLSIGTRSCTAAPGGAASEAGEVSVSVQQLVQLTAVGRFDLEEPGFTVGIGVHQLGGIGQCLVDGNDLTTDRRVDVRGRLDRFNHCTLITDSQLAADFRQLDED